LLRLSFFSDPVSSPGCKVLNRTMKNLTIFAVAAALALAGSAGAQIKHTTTHKATHKSAYKISAAKARAIALKKYPGKVEGKVALENEDGKMEYSVNVKSGKKLREIMVDANTGKIANVEVTTKAEEAKEAAAEKKAGAIKKGSIKKAVKK